MWGKVLLLLIPISFIVAGSVFFEQQKTTPDAQKKLLGTTFVSGGVVSFLLILVILVYSHMLNSKVEALKYCNTGFDVLGTMQQHQQAAH